MSAFTITLPATLSVIMRSGVAVEVEVEKLSPEIIARAAIMGLGQKTRNFAASALLNCKITATGPKANDETDAAYDKRVDRATVSTDELNAEALACMTDGLARLYAGDWGAERSAESGPAFTPEQDAAYEVIAQAAYRKGALVTAWAECKGKTTTERKTAMLAALDAMPEAFRNAIAAHAKTVADQKAQLSALLNI